MKTVFFWLLLSICFTMNNAIGQDSTSPFAPIKISFEYDLPDKVDSGFFCMVFHGHSYRSKYQIRLLNYISDIDFSNVKAHRDSISSCTPSRLRKCLLPFLFHTPHYPKAYLVIPTDSTFLTDHAITMTIERKRFFGLVKKSSCCEVSFQPERIYLLVGPHGSNLYSCSWAGNIRSDVQKESLLNQ
jgi:hypothetical protein